MNCVHIVGRKEHGKTALMLELIGRLTRRGLSVGSIKHTSHEHELDTRETDSFRQRHAGARPAAIVTGNLMGVYLPRDRQGDFYQALAPWFDACDLVLVEGDLRGPGKKIEVWRQELGGPCLALTHPDIVAVVTDDPLVLDVPVWPRSDVAALAERVLQLADCDEVMR